MQAPTSHVIKYDNISRYTLWSTPCDMDKQKIFTNIRSMQEPDRTKLLCKLIAIKYYRQTGVGNNVKDVGKQDLHFFISQQSTGV